MTKIHEGPVLARKGDLEVIDCTSCGFAHLRSGGADWSEYAEGRFQDRNWFEKERSEHQDGLWDACYEFQWRLMERCEPFLDYGCGAGWFMWYVRKRTTPIPAECVGAELAPIPQEFVPINVTGLIRSPQSQNVMRRFPTVRMSLVLEHLGQPHTFLRSHVPVWMPRRFLIVVPNEFNPLQRRVGGSWFVSRWHWNYFTPRTLTRLFNDLGYEVAYRGASFPMELFILAGFDYRDDPELGRKCHLRRLRLERTLGWQIFRVYSVLHRLLRWGREMIYAFQAKRVTAAEMLAAC